VEQRKLMSVEKKDVEKKGWGTKLWL